MINLEKINGRITLPVRDVESSLRAGINHRFILTSLKKTMFQKPYCSTAECTLKNMLVLLNYGFAPKKIHLPSSHANVSCSSCCMAKRRTQPFPLSDTIPHACFNLVQTDYEHHHYIYHHN